MNEANKIKKSISVIMPVYNEPVLTVPAVESIESFLASHFETHEIILIESGSTDQTGARCDSLAEKYETVRVIHEGRRNGFGSALRLGYRGARYDYCWLVTVDIPFPIETVLGAVELLDRYDFVISYRSEDKRAWTRRVQSWGYNFLLRAWFHLPVKCVNSAFKLLPRKAVAELPLISKHWFIDAEIIYRLVYAGYTYKEIPVPLIDRTQGASSVASNAFIKMLAEMRDFSKIRRSIPDQRKRTVRKRKKE